MSQLMESHIETLQNIFGHTSNIELFNDLEDLTKYKILTHFSINRNTLKALKKAKFSIIRIESTSDNKIEILVEIKEALS